MKVIVAVISIFAVVGAAPNETLSYACDEENSCPEGLSFCPELQIVHPSFARRCTCPDEYIASELMSECIPSGLALGDRCEINRQCHAIGGVCVDRKCTCRPNVFENTTIPGTCVSRALKEYCSPVNDGDCSVVDPKECGYDRVIALSKQGKHSVCRCPTPVDRRTKRVMMHDCTPADKPLDQPCSTHEDCHNPITRPHEMCHEGTCRCIGQAHRNADGTCWLNLVYQGDCYNERDQLRKAECFMWDSVRQENILTCTFNKCMCRNNRVFNAKACQDKGSPSPIAPSQGTPITKERAGSRTSEASKVYPFTTGTRYDGKHYCSVHEKEEICSSRRLN